MLSDQRIDDPAVGAQIMRTCGQTSAVDDLVSQGQAAVPLLDYTFADGCQLPQTTSPEVIAVMLRMLRARPGHRIVEVGTGSGYSTALLAHIAGPSGQVTSIDVDPELIERAAGLLNRHGSARVSLVCADGRHGWPPAAPYDRLIAWGSSPAIPAAWPQQVVPGGLIVAPTRQNAIGLVTAYQVARGGSLRQLQQIQAGFVPLTSEPFRPWEQE